MFSLLVTVAQLAQLGHEKVAGGCGQIEPKNLEDEMLHPEDLPLVVSVVCDVHELSNIWWVNLLVLTGDEHAGSAYQL